MNAQNRGCFNIVREKKLNWKASLSVLENFPPLSQVDDIMGGLMVEREGQRKLCFSFRNPIFKFYTLLLTADEGIQLVCERRYLLLCADVIFVKFLTPVDLSKF